MAYQTLISAFTDDPVERWLYPERSEYLAYFPRFLAAFGGRAFDEQTVWRLGEFSAVALWLPPGAEPDGDAIGAVLAQTVSIDKHADTFAVLEQMDAAHPTYPHWYLPWFGVDSAVQGEGLGSLLMEHCLVEIRRHGPPAHLPGNAQPTHGLLLRASRIRGDRQGPSRRLPADHVHAQSRSALIVDQGSEIRPN